MSNLQLEGNESEDLTQCGEELRDWFSKTDFTGIAPYANHTHGVSASRRSIGSNFIRQVSQLAGDEPLMFQGSASDRRQGRELTREWYWAKDLSQPIQLPSSPLRNHFKKVVAMVDVDEYCDMEHMLSVDFGPYLLYTFVPTTAACSEGEFAFRFMHDGTVEYVVSGGGTYRHALWDYGHDQLVVRGHEWLWVREGTLIPVRVSYTAYYKVERRNVDDHHQVVLLSPLRRWWEFLPSGHATFAYKTIAAPRLRRFNPVVGDYVRMETKTSDGLMVSTARVGDFSCSNVPVATDEEISLKSHLTGDKLTVAMAKSSMASHNVLGPVGAEVLTAFHRTNKGCGARVFKASDGVRGYQFTYPKLANYDPDVKPSMSAFMRPLVHGGFCPDLCESNDIVAVDKRVKVPQNHTRVTEHVNASIQAFVGYLANEILVPVDEEEVIARQSRATQRAILERANYQTSTGKAHVFIKRQAETNIKDARLITPIDGADKKSYSAYLYALARVMKRLPWYASGMTPLAVARRVADVCIEAHLLGQLAETDFSRMDGRISEVPRHLEVTAMKALFHPSCHVEMLSLMRKQTHLRCTTKFGVHYDSGLARGSGSPETSAFNSLLTGFTFFYAMVLDGKDYEDAWDVLCKGGVCLGDDGLMAGLRVTPAESAARLVGQKLTLSIKTTGDTVSFLARHYGPNVWFGETDSCCSLARQLSKFHLATCVKDDAESAVLKLREKSFAFWLTDEHTPVLGDFVCKVLQLAPVQHGPGIGEIYTNALGIWNSDIDKSEQYPSLPDKLGWKRELMETELPDFSIAKFSEWLTGTKTLYELMQAPDPIVIPAVHPGDSHPPVVVDGDVLMPPKKVSPRRKRGGKRTRRVKQGEKQKIRGNTKENPQLGAVRSS